MRKCFLCDIPLNHKVILCSGFCVSMLILKWGEVTKRRATMCPWGAFLVPCCASVNAPLDVPNVEPIRVTSDVGLQCWPYHPRATCCNMFLSSEASILPTSPVVIRHFLVRRPSALAFGTSLFQAHRRGSRVHDWCGKLALFFDAHVR